MWLVVVLSLAACNRDDEVLLVEPAKPVAMSFNASVDGLATTRVVTNLETFYSEFYVSAVKNMSDNTQQTVMPGYVVRFADTWHYDGLTGLDGSKQYLKYWDLSAGSYTFSAVTPLPNNAADASFAWKETTVSVDDDGKISINNIKGNISHDNSLNSAGAPDWMVARTVRRGVNDASQLLDYDDIANSGTVFPKPQVPYAEVPLMFHHIFADVEFRAYATSNVSLKKFRVMSEDEMVNQADYVDGWTHEGYASNSYQDPMRFGDYNYESGRSLGTSVETAITLARHVQIPQTFPEAGRTFKITIETEEGKTYTGTITLTKDNNGTNSWLQNVHYIYILKIDTSESGEQPIILFAVDLDVWKWKEGNSAEETQTNW